jgi:hypothetical protein
MKTPFQPLPDDEPPMDLQQFLARLKLEPGFAETMRKHYEAALALPLTPETEDLHQSASAALRTLRHHQGAVHCQKVLKTIIETVETPGFTPDPDELRGLLAKTEEAVDHLLDVMEPERTRFMTKLVEMRDRLRQLLDKA